MKEIPKDLGLKIGTKEQVFLTEELEANKQALERLKKAIKAIEWINPIIERRLKEIEDEV